MLGIPLSTFPCTKGLSHIPGKADQFIPGQFFSVFPNRSPTVLDTFRTPSQVVFILELLMNPRKSLKFGLKVYAFLI